MYPKLTVLFCTPTRLRNHHRHVTAAHQFTAWLIIMTSLAILVTNYLTASVTILSLKRHEAQPAQPAQDEGAGAGGGQEHQEDQLGDEYPHPLNPFN